LLVDPDPESFASAAVVLREDPGALPRAGRVTAERLDWPAVASSFLALYDELYAVVQDAREPAMAPVFYSSTLV